MACAHERDWALIQSFTCPACGRVSYHPRDLDEGYCGACHDYTGSRPFLLSVKNPALGGVAIEDVHLKTEAL